MPFPHPTRTARGRVAAGMSAAGVLVALLLGGCTGAPAPTPNPTPTSSAAEPVFASDEEALAAAEEAYEHFEEVSGAIAADGGEDSDRIDAVASARYSPELKKEFEQYRELGLRTVGSSSVDSIRLAERSQSAGHVEVAIYLCRDVSSVRVLDSAGIDVTPASRDDRTPLAAVLVSSSLEGELVVDEVELWPGDDFC